MREFNWYLPAVVGGGGILIIFSLIGIKFRIW